MPLSRMRRLAAAALPSETFLPSWLNDLLAPAASAATAHSCCRRCCWLSGAAAASHCCGCSHVCAAASWRACSAECAGLQAQPLHMGAGPRAAFIPLELRQHRYRVCSWRAAQPLARLPAHATLTTCRRLHTERAGRQGQGQMKRHSSSPAFMCFEWCIIQCTLHPLLHSLANMASRRDQRSPRLSRGMAGPAASRGLPRLTSALTCWRSTHISSLTATRSIILHLHLPKAHCYLWRPLFLLPEPHAA